MGITEIPVGHEGVCSSEKHVIKSLESLEGDSRRADLSLTRAIIELSSREKLGSQQDNSFFIIPKETLALIANDFLKEKGENYEYALHLLAQNNIKFIGLRPGKELSMETLLKVKSIDKNEFDKNREDNEYSLKELLGNLGLNYKKLAGQDEKLTEEDRKNILGNYENADELWSDVFEKDGSQVGHLELISEALNDDILKGGIKEKISKDKPKFIADCFNNPTGGYALERAIYEGIITEADIPDKPKFIADCLNNSTGGRVLERAIYEGIITEADIPDKPKFIADCFNNPTGGYVLERAIDRKIITKADIPDKPQFIKDCLNNSKGGRVLERAIYEGIITEADIPDKRQFIADCFNNPTGGYALERAIYEGIITEADIPDKRQFIADCLNNPKGGRVLESAIRQRIITEADIEKVKKEKNLTQQKKEEGDELDNVFVLQPQNKD